MLISSAISMVVNSSGRFIKDTLDEGFFTLSQIGYSENKKFVWLRYWPSYLAGTVAIASTIAAIAARALNNLALTIVQSVIAVGAYVLTGTLHVFIPLKQLERQTDVLKQQNTLLQQQNIDLEKTEKTLKADISSLSFELDRRTQEHRDLTTKMDQHVAKLHTTLLAAEEKQKALSDMLLAIRQASDSFKTNAKTLETLEHNITEKGQAIAQATGNLSRVTDTLSHQLSDLKAQHAASQSEYETALSFADSLSHLFTSIQDIYHKTQIEEQRMKEELEAMQKTSSGLSHTTANFSQSVDQLQQFLNQAKQQAILDFGKPTGA